MIKPIADKILQYFDYWKGKTVSYMGQAYLIDSVITSSFVHSFMVYMWPTFLIKYMNSTIRNYLWSSSISSRMVMTVAWLECCLPKRNGVLGLKKLLAFNAALLSILAWKVMTLGSSVFSAS